jgi:hypothetical protein
MPMMFANGTGVRASPSMPNIFVYPFGLVSSGLTSPGLASSPLFFILWKAKPISQVTTARIINTRKTVAKLLPATEAARPQSTVIGIIAFYLTNLGQTGRFYTLFGTLFNS